MKGESSVIILNSSDPDDIKIGKVTVEGIDDKTVVLMPSGHDGEKQRLTVMLLPKHPW